MATYTGHNGQVFQNPTALLDPHDAFPSVTHRQQGFGSQQPAPYSPYATMQTSREGPQGRLFGHSQPTSTDWYPNGRLNPLQSPNRSARPPGEQNAPLRRKAATWEEYDPNDNTQAPPDKFAPQSQARATGRLFLKNAEDSVIVLDSGARISLVHPRQIARYDRWPEVFTCEPYDSTGLYRGRALLDIQIDLNIYVGTIRGLQSIEVWAYVLPWSDPRTHRILIGATDLKGNGIDLLFTGDQARMKKGTARACHFPIDLRV